MSFSAKTVPLAWLAVAILILALVRPAAAGAHMELTWDFYNDSPNNSFARYHLATLGYTSPRYGDLTVLYDWFDWTQGEDNKHALTPWAAMYTYRYPAPPESRTQRSVQLGHWLVWDLVDHLDDRVILRQTRATYAVERALGPHTRFIWRTALYTPGGLGQLSLAGSATLQRSWGRARISLGVNDLSTLDSLLYNAGRVPVTLGLDLAWSPGTTMHAYAIRLIGPEPERMPSVWVRSDSALFYRLGWDFRMF